MTRLAVLALVSIMSASAGQAAECDDTAKAYGEVLRAAAICGFGRTPAVDRTERVMRESCPNSDSARASIEVGSRVFDHDKGRRGLHEACFSFTWAQRFEEPPQ